MCTNAQYLKLFESILKQGRLGKGKGKKREENGNSKEQIQLEE
jgi:hypothetical protein